MASILNSFPKIAATRKRYSSGADVNGHWVNGTPVSTPINIVAPQPANGNELQLLPDGERQYTHYKLWSTAELLPDDEVTISGTNYLVVLNMDYEIACQAEQFDGFYKAMVRKVQ